MPGNQIGEVEIAVKASVENFTKEVSDEIHAKSEGTGSKMGTLLVNGLKTAGVAAAAAAGAAITATLVKGFQRLGAIDAAKAKLQGLGVTGKELEGVMNNALNSVKGTAFGLDEAVSAVPGLLAAGVKPGKDLEQALKNMGSTATLAGTSFTEVSDIFGDAAAAGRVTTDTFNRMASRGIPALQLVADSLGVTREEAAKMTSEGKISFQQFQDALTQGIGPAALAAGDSFSGMTANVGAAMGRLGAVILGPVFEGVKQVMPELMTALDEVGEAIKPLVEDLGPKLKDVFSNVAKAIKNVNWTEVVNNIKTVVGIFIDWAPVILSVVAAFLALKTIIFITGTVMKAYNAIAAVVKAFQLGMAAATYGQVGATYALAGASNILKVATLAGAAAQWVLNSAFLANPITWIIIAVIALIAAIVLLVLNWDKVVKFITDVWGGFIEWITGVIEGFISWWSGVWEGIVEVWNNIWTAILNNPVIKFIGAMIKAYIDIWIGIFLILAAVLKVIWEAIVTAVTWAWNQIVGFITPIIDFIVGVITDAFTAVSDWWTGLWESITSFFEDAWNGLIAFITPIVLRIYNAIKGPIDRILGWWRGVWNSVKQVFSDIWDGLVRTVGVKVLEVYNKIITIKDKVLGFFSGAINWLKNIGRDIIQGLINGIKGMIDNVRNAVSDVFNGAVEWAKGILKSNSPSKVFDDIGRDLGLGFVQGVNAMANSVQTAVGDLATGAIDVAQTVVAQTPVHPSEASARGYDAIPTTTTTTTNNSPTVNVIGELHPERTAKAVVDAIAAKAVVVGA